MITFFSREDEDIAEQVRQELLDGKKVEWHTLYETFYGIGWAKWVREQLEDIDCKIKEIDWDKTYAYPSTLLITPKR